MCECPTIIRNPYAGCDPSKGYNYLHDCVSAFIQVPCGKCRECIATKQDTYSVRSLVERSRSIPFMLTLTYDQKHVPRMDKCGDVLDDFAYPDYKHVSDMFKRLRSTIDKSSWLSSMFAEPIEEKLYNSNKVVKTPPFKYLAVQEYGKINLRPHFHILLFVRIPSALNKKSRQSVEFNCWCTDVERFLYAWFKHNWAINVGDNWHPVYETLYTYVRSGKYCTYDFHRIVECDASPSNSPVYYVTKYLYKFNKKLDKFVKMVFAKYKQGQISEDRFIFFKKKCRMCAKTSNYFGFPFSEDEINRVLRSISQSKNETPCFPKYYDSEGVSHPFPRTWKPRFLLLDDRTHFAYMFEENTNELIDFQYESRKRIQNTGLVERIAERIQNRDDGVDSLLGWCYTPDKLWNDQSSSEAAETRFDYNDFCDDLESNFYNDRSTCNPSVEEHPGHPQNPEIITLTLF